MNGKSFVLVFVGFALAGAAGAVLYRRASRAPLALELGKESARGSAFLQLLRMNNAWGLANEYTYDARPDGPGKAYLHARSDSGRAWHVVRAVREAGGALATSAFVFEEDGRLARCVENAVPVSLGGTGGAGELAALIVRRDGSAPARSVLVVDGELTEALRIRGDFQVEGMERPDVGTEPGAPPVFRYDAVAKCFRGPPGASDKPWEVDRSHSPGYCP
jgi:hypothetical protein